MKDEELSDPPPPSAERVARRAIVLSVISCRGIVESDNANPTNAAGLAKRSRDWLHAIGLEEELSDWERDVLASPFGSLSERDRINASWLSEAVTILAWSLGKLELPGLEDQCDPERSASSLGFLKPVGATALNGPQLRAPNILQEYNEFIYHVHWRIRDFSLIERPYDFESIARKAWGEPILRHGLQINEKDLCVDGVPIFSAPEDKRCTLASITQERHRASNWLIGYGSEDFYEVTTDT